MKPIAIFINIAGPIKHEVHGMVHQVEMGVAQKGKKKGEVTHLAIPSVNMVEAIDTIMPSFRAYLEKYYVPEKPTNVVKLK